jgi:hypothetical protein
MPTHFASKEAARTAGLLEQPTLRLHAPGAGGRRLLSDDKGAAVGFAVEVRAWWPWGRSLCVHEAFDEPVVFRVRRLWSLRPRWRVVDADGEEVGTVGGPALRDRWDRVLFRRVDGGRAFELVQGGPAAEWLANGDGGRLALHAAVRDDPFWKMLLLAAVLVG